jgi:hypothetical protein
MWAKRILEAFGVIPGVRLGYVTQVLLKKFVVS